MVSYFNPMRQTKIEEARVQTESIKGEVHLETESPCGQIEAEERMEKETDDVAAY